MAETSLPAARRTALLCILWNEGNLKQDALVARTETLLGPRCFGKRPSLSIARDIRFLREVLEAAGYQLRYSRRRDQSGYYVLGRPRLALALIKKIEAAVREVYPEQIAIYARLTPAQRVRQGASLSDRLRRHAASRLREQDPDLDQAAASREALQRMYSLDR